VRVIAGIARGRKLKGFRGWDIRPTPDQVKEALFNILGARIAGSHFLDLCAGTGAIGLEALSRGAQRVIWVEYKQKACQLIEENRQRCGFTTQGILMRCDVLRAIPLLEKAGERFDFIFLDPPYRSPLAEQILQKLATSHLLAPAGLVIAEHSEYTTLASQYGALKQGRQKVFGQVTLSFYHQENCSAESIQ
jgi:16S rRNA (guanine(966)-N(2))-methyltransferase RsmD